MEKNLPSIQEFFDKSLINPEVKISWILLNKELLQNFKSWNFHAFFTNLRNFFSINFFAREISWNDVFHILSILKQNIEDEKIKMEQDIVKNKVKNILDFVWKELQSLEEQKNEILKFLQKLIKDFELNKNNYFSWIEVSDLLIPDFKVYDFEKKYYLTKNYVTKN